MIAIDRPGASRSAYDTGCVRGFGLGLRLELLDLVADGPQLEVDFLEVAPENFMRRGGRVRAAFERIVDRYPVITHGLCLSLGGTEPAEDAYVAELRREVAYTRTPWHSDHLCFSSAGPIVLHDLLPLSCCEANAVRVADRLRWAEDRLAVPMAIENISWYAHPGRMQMPEVEFIARVLDLSGCGLLLDVNNVWVNACNHGFSPTAFIADLPLERVVQIHVAGHKRVQPDLVIDTHGAPVADPVLELLSWTLERTGPVPVLLERDNDIPPLPDLIEELRRVATFGRQGIARHEEARARGA